MLSNQILHKTVQDIKRITGLECGVWDMDAKCLVMTSERMLGLEKEVASFCRKALKEAGTGGGRRRAVPCMRRRRAGLYTGAGGAGSPDVHSGKDGSQPACQPSVCI